MKFGVFTGEIYITKVFQPKNNTTGIGKDKEKDFVHWMEFPALKSLKGSNPLLPISGNEVSAC